MSTLKLGTVTVLSPITLCPDGDDTGTVTVDYWIPDDQPIVGDRVIFDIIGTQIVAFFDATFGEGGAYVGEIRMFGFATLPTNWLLCDGAAVSRTTYARLFAKVGTTYGVGDGSTTFNTPNFTNKFPRGNTQGVGGGVDTHAHGAGTLVAQITVTTGPKVAINRTGVSGWTSNQEAVPASINAGGATGIATGANIVNSTDTQNNIPAYTGVRFGIKW